MSDQSVFRPVMFVCYSSKDKTFVEQLVAVLAKHGITLWYDRWSMKPGDKLLPKIAEGIENCRYFGVVVSRDSLESPWVQHELDAAMIRFIEDKNIRIIPIITGNVKPREMPVALRGFVYVDLRDTTSATYAERVRTLVDAIVLPRPAAEPDFEPGTVSGPQGDWLEDALFAFATDPRLRPKDQDDLRSGWPEAYCRSNRLHFVAATDYLIHLHYSDQEVVQNLVQCLHAIFSTHGLPVRQLPVQVIRVIDDDDYDDETRAVAIRVAGLLDYPLGEDRLGRLLIRRWNRIIYSVCEYLEYRVGVLESEDLASRLLAVLNRPDSVAYFSAYDESRDEEVDSDIRYYAARCLALAELKPEMEAIVVDLIRTKYPEVEDEVGTMLLNSIALGALGQSNSRLWKRHSGKLESVFQRVDARSDNA